MISRPCGCCLWVDGDSWVLDRCPLHRGPVTVVGESMRMGNKGGVRRCGDFGGLNASGARCRSTLLPAQVRCHHHPA